jgi:hypothetical protein
MVYRSEDQASTAYGGLADVPGDIDMLWVSTSLSKSRTDVGIVSLGHHASTTRP